MASQTEICNLALTRLGQQGITTITEASAEARTCLRLWDNARRSSLRAHPWNFALGTAALAVVSETPPDYIYAYQIPADSVKVCGLVNPVIPSTIYIPFESYGWPAGWTIPGYTIIAEPLFFEIRKGQKIYTNLEDAIVKYIADTTDTSSWDDQFVDYLAYKLAADLAMPIVGDLKFLQAMTQLAERALIRAKTGDAQEARKRVDTGQSFLQSRL